MFRGILTLTLSLCLGAAAAPAALAQAAAPITEQEAHAIAVDAYIYFYPLLSMDISRKQFTNVEPRQGIWQGPDEHVRQRARISASRFQRCRALQLRHAVFHLHGST